MRVSAAPRLRAVEGGVPSAPPPRNDRRLGDILVARGQLDADGLRRVLEQQRGHPVRFGDAAVQLGLITPDDLRQALTAQYELPQLRPGRRRVSLELVTAYEPCHPCAEQIRALRAQLQLRQGGGQGSAARMLAIVSPTHGDGRSYIAANLAVAYAQLGRHTLLIDADLRRPRQHQIFDVPDRVGLSTVLGGRADHHAAHALPAFGPLHLLPAGASPPNPLDLLARPAWAALLQACRRHFDMVVLDTPSALGCADACTLARDAGQALVIARRDHTRLHDTARLVAQLQDQGAEVIGTVLNAT
ncbi:MAG: hypothetical protein RLZZ584_882 [Pseudomonadota bacterium]|jgi:chain length determinant protein tyrosine kinase EpsG